MPGKGLVFSAAILIVIFGFLAGNTSAFAADKEKVVYNFDSDSSPWANGIISDAAGNLYGMTFDGGSSGYGSVFELSRLKDGAWTETLLYSFCSSGCGAVPEGTLAFDSAGNLYGATTQGGANRYEGLAFQLVRSKSGEWKENILHEFTGGDGWWPTGAVVLDQQGNVYGVTENGGNSCDCGIVYQLKPGSNGHWTEKLIHKFVGTDGSNPFGGLTMDVAGNLYGGTLYGGSSPCNNPEGFGCGVVFELSPKANGQWAFKVLHSFEGKDGDGPWTRVVFDSSGRLYGTTVQGGDISRCDPPYGRGTVFQLAPEANGRWREKVLHSFHLFQAAFPGAVVVDAAGNLYGTTPNGGEYFWGSAFELTPSGGGGCGLTWLHSFGNGGDGRDPIALIFGKDGGLYGTTAGGGAYGYGTLFELTP